MILQNLDSDLHCRVARSKGRSFAGLSMLSCKWDRGPLNSKPWSCRCSMLRIVSVQSDCKWLHVCECVRGVCVWVLGPLGLVRQSWKMLQQVPGNWQATWTCAKLAEICCPGNEAWFLQSVMLHWRTATSMSHVALLWRIESEPERTPQKDAKETTALKQGKNKQSEEWNTILKYIIVNNSLEIMATEGRERPVWLSPRVRILCLGAPEANDKTFQSHSRVSHRKQRQKGFWKSNSLHGFLSILQKPFCQGCFQSCENYDTTQPVFKSDTSEATACHGPCVARSFRHSVDIFRFWNWTGQQRNRDLLFATGKGSAYSLSTSIRKLAGDPSLSSWPPKSSASVILPDPWSLATSNLCVYFLYTIPFLFRLPRTHIFARCAASGLHTAQWAKKQNMLLSQKKYITTPYAKRPSGQLKSDFPVLLRRTWQHICTSFTAVLLCCELHIASWGKVWTM